MLHQVLQQFGDLINCNTAAIKFNVNQMVVGSYRDGALVFCIDI